MYAVGGNSESWVVLKCWSGVCTVRILHVRRGVCEGGWRSVEILSSQHDWRKQ